MAPPMKKISIVIPVFNEDACLNELYSHLVPALKNLPYSFEILFIDDGSTDRSFEVIRQLKAADPRIQGIKFSRNFGHQRALFCGLEQASGDAVIMMDADLQHPPALIPQMLQKWEDGFSVVNTLRKDSGSQSPLKKMTSSLFYKLFSWMTGLKTGENFADFRLVDRKVADQIKTAAESVFFLRGLITWLGFKQISLEYTPAGRFAGKTKYTLRKMIELGIDGLTSFSVLPVRLGAILGVLLIFINLVYFFCALFSHFILGETDKKWTSVTFILTSYGAVQIFLIGLIGEYLAKIHFETKKRPKYVIEEKLP